jgi:endonuclease IV
VFGYVPANLAFCLDTTHVIPVNITANTADESQAEVMRHIAEFVERMGVQLRHVHLSNSTVLANRQMEHHRHLDDGFIPPGVVKSHLIACGYSGKVVLELPKDGIERDILLWNGLATQ